MDKSLRQRIIASVIMLIATVASISFLIYNNKTTKIDLPVGDIKPVIVEPSEFPDYNSLTIILISPSLHLVEERK